MHVFQLVFNNYIHKNLEFNSKLMSIFLDKHKIAYDGVNHDIILRKPNYTEKRII